MAQDPGADSFIAPRAKIASAGGILALAIAAVLAVSGCGGDSNSQTASAPRPQGQAAQHPGESSPGDGPPSSQGGEGSGDPKSQENGSSASAHAAAAGQGPGKHGPTVKLPKGAPEPGPTARQEAQATVASIALSSPALSPAAGESEAKLPSAYTCDGKGDSPELRWQGIPAGSAELVLLVLNLEPIDEALFFDWAVAGIDPSLEGLQAGSLPKGAVLGKNSFGHEAYEICPPKGQAETFIFALYALPKSLSPRQGFDPTALRKQVLEASGNAGLLAASYGG